MTATPGSGVSRMSRSAILASTLPTSSPRVDAVACSDAVPAGDLGRPVRGQGVPGRLDVDHEVGDGAREAVHLEVVALRVQLPRHRRRRPLAGEVKVTFQAARRPLDLRNEPREHAQVDRVEAYVEGQPRVAAQVVDVSAEEETAAQRIGPAGFERHLERSDGQRVVGEDERVPGRLERELPAGAGDDGGPEQQAGARRSRRGERPIGDHELPPELPAHGRLGARHHRRVLVVLRGRGDARHQAEVERAQRDAPREV